MLYIHKYQSRPIVVPKQPTSLIGRRNIADGQACKQQLSHRQSHHHGEEVGNNERHDDQHEDVSTRASDEDEGATPKVAT